MSRAPFPLASLGAMLLTAGLGAAVDPKGSIGEVLIFWILISAGMLGYAIDLIRKDASS